MGKGISITAQGLGARGEEVTYLSVGCAVGLGLGEATRGGCSEAVGSSQEEVSGWGVAGAMGAAWLGSQQLWGSWNSSKTGQGVVSGWHRHHTGLCSTTGLKLSIPAAQTLGSRQRRVSEITVSTKHFKVPFSLLK